MKTEKKKKIAEVLRTEGIGKECNRYGLSYRRGEFTRCDRCTGKVKVSADILLRIAYGQSIIICGACLGQPGSPEERPFKETIGYRENL